MSPLPPRTEPAGVGEVLTLVESMADLPHLGEPVSQLAHALQTATRLADENRAAPVVVAGLLHDIGYARCVRGGVGGSSADQSSRALPHEEAAALWLAGPVHPDVVRLVASHVGAKRYLVAVEDGYASTLSPASRRSLQRQGGPMTPEEAQECEALPWWPDAVALRRADEQAKVPGTATASLADLRPFLAACWLGTGD